MRRICCICFIFILALTTLVALESPTEQTLISSEFGQAQYQTFSRGIVYDEVNTVRAAEAGRILIILEDSTFPSTLGNAVILVHDESIITVYGNLDDDIIAGDISDEVDCGAIIGRCGTSGFPKNRSLEFQAVDLIRKTKINPQLLLPATEDLQNPVIRDTFLQNANNVRYAASTVKRIRQGEYVLYSSVHDTSHKAQKSAILAPFHIAISLNGMETQHIAFETLIQEHSRLKLVTPQRNYSYEELYIDDVLNLGSIVLKRGKNDIQISVRDIAGNTGSINWILTAD